VFGVAAVV